MSTAWFHVIFSTYGTWLRGDRRGFRDHGHRIHSSGDYRNPPPPHEHAGLRRWTARVMHKNPVRLSPALRERVGRALVERLHELNVQVIAVSVSEDHVHMLAHLPVATTRKVVGLAKSRASFRVRDVIPGTLWGRRCKAKPIRDREHHVKTFNYILKHKRKGAWTWTFRDGPVS